MKIDDDILSRFPRPCDGMIYIYLNIKGGGEITYQQIANDTDYTKDHIKASVINLINQKAIKAHSTPDGFMYEICKKGINSLKIKEREEREKKFYKSLIPFLNTYPKEMLREFYDYWSEPNKSQTKMRYESEKTWDLPRRLARWAKLDNKYGHKKTTNAALDAGATALERVLTTLEG